MSILGRNFNEIAAQKPQEEKAGSKCPPPFSIRFTFEERARLDAERGRQPLSAYIRERLFGDDATPRKKIGQPEEIVAKLRQVDVAVAQCKQNFFPNEGTFHGRPFK